MFQRLLQRQGQTARWTLSNYTSSTAPFVLRQTTRLQPRPLAYRYYSTDKPAEETKKEAEGAEPTASTDDALRQDIAKKEKEVIDLKVILC